MRRLQLSELIYGMLLKSGLKVNSKKKHWRCVRAKDAGLRVTGWSLIVCSILLLFGQRLQADEVLAYRDAVRQQAAALGLHTDTTWLYLLHYYPAVPDSRSDITDRRFFLAETGNRDPEAELDATLKAIFDSDLSRGDRHAQCLFRSRFVWLDRQLTFDRRYLPAAACKSYNGWRGLIRAQSISLVFASSFMDNPGSVYGHTFLKINSEKGGRRLNLLDHVIQYQALPEDQVGLLYAIKGIFGGYRGLYPLDPYYIPIQNNIEFEDRSIWEYELDLTDQQLELLLTHSWELAHFYTDYYFFKQNCAYRILELIEIAAPQYRFKDRFPFWAMPSQAVVYVLQEEGLVRQVNYFPARTRQLMQKFESLEASEQQLVRRLPANPELLDEPAFQQLPRQRQIRILDTVLDYLRSRINRKRNEPENAVVRRRFLLARSRLGRSEPYEVPLPDEQSIHLGHAPARFEAGLGRRGDLGFLELAVRPSYHDLLADETGHLRNSHFTTVDIVIRAYEHETALHQLEIIQLFDLAPNNIISDDWSWRLKAGVYPSTARSCIHCRKSLVQMGYGKSRALFSGSGAVYLLAHGALEADREYEEEAMLGAGLDAGMLLQLTDAWKIHASLTGTRGVLGEDHEHGRAALQQRWKLGQHRDLRLNWQYQTEHEFKLALHWYF